MKSIIMSLRYLNPRAMVFAVCCLLSSQTGAEGLTLEQAERLALDSDPATRASLAGKRALDELAIAARQLDDPKIRAGLVSLPIDTFNLGQEPMTQIQLGIQQRFPRGNSRELGGIRFEKKSQQVTARIEDQKLQLVLRVNQLFLEAILQDRLAAILAQSVRLFEDLEDITTAYYETGRVQQQDVLNVQVERSKVLDQIAATRQKGEQSRAMLAEKIGSRAYGKLLQEWPDPGELSGKDTSRAQLEEHPRLKGLRKQIEFAQTGEELARQQFKPGFTVDLGYGARGGNNPDGSSRPDFLSLMVTMDLPLFTSRRQDRVLSARIAETESASYARDDTWRRMNAELDFHMATLERTNERLELYQGSLLPQAGFYTVAALESYQDATGDLTSLILAQVAEYKLRMGFVQLQADRLKTIASLKYLSGKAL